MELINMQETYCVENGDFVVTLVDYMVQTVFPN